MFGSKFSVESFCDAGYETRNLSVDEIGERYRSNHAIAVACQAVVCGTMCLQAACSCLFTQRPSADVMCYL